MLTTVGLSGGVLKDPKMGRATRFEALGFLLFVAVADLFHNPCDGQ